MRAIISLRIGASLNMPTKRSRLLLRDMALGNNRARNAAMRAWIRFHEDHPDWQPEQRRDRKGELRFKEDGTRPLMEHPAVGARVSKLMYQAALEAAPNVAAKISSSCAREVAKYLTNRVPAGHDGKARFIWQGILSHEIQAPSYHSLSIPIPTQDTAICWQGETNRVLSRRVNESVVAAGNSSCVLRFPLLSRKSGQRECGMIVRLLIGRLSAGHKQLLRDVVSGAKPLCDSEIIFRKRRRHKSPCWFFQLAYKHEVYDLGLSNAAKERSLELALMPEHAGIGPFAVTTSDRDTPWWVGSYKPFEAEHIRLTIRRKALRERYKHGVRRGRGKQYALRALRPYSRAFRDMQDRYLKSVVSDTIKACQRFDCGQIVYYEPSKPLRDSCWFSTRGIPMNWTQLRARLEAKCQQYGIDLEVRMLRKKDVAFIFRILALPLMQRARSLS